VLPAPVVEEIITPEVEEPIDEFFIEDEVEEEEKVEVDLSMYFIT